MKRVSIIVFPGSNCDHDIIHLYQRLLGQHVEIVWHTESDLKRPDIVVLPGGFSYGDYLRTGALAKISPVMRAVAAFAKSGGPVLGICNGFQILCESGLLPGALLQNVGMKFLSQFVHIKIENTATPFTHSLSKGSIIRCPIAHFEGNYFVDTETVQQLEEKNQIVFRYCDPNGAVAFKDAHSNPNGALHAIAGICNEAGNVVGMMPHPERAAEVLVGACGGATGLPLFDASLQWSMQSAM